MELTHRAVKVKLAPTALLYGGEPISARGNDLVIAGMGFTCGFEWSG